MVLGFLKQTPDHQCIQSLAHSSRLLAFFQGLLQRSLLFCLCVLPSAVEAVPRSLILFEKTSVGSWLTTTDSLTYSIFSTIFCSSLHHPHLLTRGSLLSQKPSWSLASFFPKRKPQGLAPLFPPPFIPPIESSAHFSHISFYMPYGGPIISLGGNMPDGTPTLIPPLPGLQYILLEQPNRQHPSSTFNPPSYTIHLSSTSSTSWVSIKLLNDMFLWCGMLCF